jgi:arylsulfatase
MLGKSDTTGRDSYMFFGADGELMSVKWKICKVIFRYTEAHAADKPYVMPQMPMFCDLSSDPHEDNNLLYYEDSLKQYPNIKVGEEFAGSKK